MVKETRYYAIGWTYKDKPGSLAVLVELWNLEDNNRHYKDMYRCVEC